MINAIVIIPAKSDSKRLPGKNKRIVNEKTLIEHAIDYAKSSKLVSRIIVSTEDYETKQIAEKNNVETLTRSTEFMGEREVVDVYVDVIKKLKSIDSLTHVVGVQPDHPDRSSNLDNFLNYVVENKYDDFFTVNKDGSRNGAVRIFKIEHLLQGYVSRRVGSQFDLCTNIHSEADLKQASDNIISRID